MTGTLAVPRSRGAVCGSLLVLLGAWGALIPFVGPYFDYAYTPDATWDYTTGRLYLEILPGVATAVGGLLVLGSANRVTAMFGSCLAALAGAWFVLGIPSRRSGTSRPSVRRSATRRANFSSTSASSEASAW